LSPHISEWDESSLNTNLTNYGKNTYFWTCFETIRILTLLVVCRYPKNKFKKKKKKTLVDNGGLRRKCACQMLTIQNLDVVTSELVMKVQLTNF
jgi:hypothetical protein